MFLENLKIALVAIFANKMRSILTVLGVMIGVAAVLAVVSLVQGMQYKMSQDLQAIGSNYIEVFPDAGEERNPFLQKFPELTADDAVAVRKAATSISEFTPLYITNAELKNADAVHRAQLLGAHASYQDAFNHWVEHGRFFSVLHEDAKKKDCVIGVTVADKLNLGSNPIGKQTAVENNRFTVVGVMEKKGGQFGQDRDDIVLIPFTTATVMYGADNMKRLVLAFQMRPGSDLDLAREQVTEALRLRHHLKKGQRDDFRILAQEEILKTISNILGYITRVIGGMVSNGLPVGRVRSLD